MSIGLSSVRSVAACRNGAAMQRDKASHRRGVVALAASPGHNIVTLDSGAMAVQSVAYVDSRPKVGP